MGLIVNRGIRGVDRGALSGDSSSMGGNTINNDLDDKAGFFSVSDFVSANAGSHTFFLIKSKTLEVSSFTEHNARLGMPRIPFLVDSSFEAEQYRQDRKEESNSNNGNNPHGPPMKDALPHLNLMTSLGKFINWINIQPQYSWHNSAWNNKSPIGNLFEHSLFKGVSILRAASIKALWRGQKWEESLPSGSSSADKKATDFIKKCVQKAKRQMHLDEAQRRILRASDAGVEVENDLDFSTILAGNEVIPNHFRVTLPKQIPRKYRYWNGSYGREVFMPSEEFTGWDSVQDFIDWVEEDQEKLMRSLKITKFSALSEAKIPEELVSEDEVEEWKASLKKSSKKQDFLGVFAPKKEKDSEEHLTTPKQLIRSSEALSSGRKGVVLEIMQKFLEEDVEAKLNANDEIDANVGKKSSSHRNALHSRVFKSKNKAIIDRSLNFMNILGFETKKIEILRADVEVDTETKTLDRIKDVLLKGQEFTEVVREPITSIVEPEESPTHVVGRSSIASRQVVAPKKRTAKATQKKKEEVRKVTLEEASLDRICEQDEQKVEYILKIIGKEKSVREKRRNFICVKKNQLDAKKSRVMKRKDELHSEFLNSMQALMPEIVKQRVRSAFRSKLHQFGSDKSDKIQKGLDSILDLAYDQLVGGEESIELKKLQQELADLEEAPLEGRFKGALEAPVGMQSSLIDSSGSQIDSGSRKALSNAQRNPLVPQTLAEAVKLQVKSAIQKMYEDDARAARQDEQATLTKQFAQDIPGFDLNVAYDKNILHPKYYSAKMHDKKNLLNTDFKNEASFSALVNDPKSAPLVKSLLAIDEHWTIFGKGELETENGVEDDQDRLDELETQADATRRALKNARDARINKRVKEVLEMELMELELLEPFKDQPDQSAQPSKASVLRRAQDLKDREEKLRKEIEDRIRREEDARDPLPSKDDLYKRLVEEYLYGGEYLVEKGFVLLSREEDEIDTSQIISTTNNSSSSSCRTALQRKMVDFHRAQVRLRNRERALHSRLYGSEDGWIQGNIDVHFKELSGIAEFMELDDGNEVHEDGNEDGDEQNNLGSKAWNLLITTFNKEFHNMESLFKSAGHENFQIIARKSEMQAQIQEIREKIEQKKQNKIENEMEIVEFAPRNNSSPKKTLFAQIPKKNLFGASSPSRAQKLLGGASNNSSKKKRMQPAQRHNVNQASPSKVEQMDQMSASKSQMNQLSASQNQKNQLSGSKSIGQKRLFSEMSPAPAESPAPENNLRNSISLKKNLLRSGGSGKRQATQANQMMSQGPGMTSRQFEAGRGPQHQGPQAPQIPSGLDYEEDSDFALEELERLQQQHADSAQKYGHQYFGERIQNANGLSPMQGQQLQQIQPMGFDPMPMQNLPPLRSVYDNGNPPGASMFAISAELQNNSGQKIQKPTAHNNNYFTDLLNIKPVTIKELVTETVTPKSKSLADADTKSDSKADAAIENLSKLALHSLYERYGERITAVIAITDGLQPVEHIHLWLRQNVKEIEQPQGSLPQGTVSRRINFIKKWGSSSAVDRGSDGPGSDGLPEYWDHLQNSLALEWHTELIQQKIIGDMLDKISNGLDSHGRSAHGLGRGLVKNAEKRDEWSLKQRMGILELLEGCDGFSSAVSTGYSAGVATLGDIVAGGESSRGELLASRGEFTLTASTLHQDIAHLQESIIKQKEQNVMQNGGLKQKFPFPIDTSLLNFVFGEGKQLGEMAGEYSLHDGKILGPEMLQSLSTPMFGDLVFGVGANFGEVRGYVKDEENKIGAKNSSRNMNNSPNFPTKIPHPEQADQIFSSSDSGFHNGFTISGISKISDEDLRVTQLDVNTQGESSVAALLGAGDSQSGSLPNIIRLIARPQPNTNPHYDQDSQPFPRGKQSYELLKILKKWMNQWLKRTAEKYQKTRNVEELNKLMNLKKFWSGKEGLLSNSDRLTLHWVGYDREDPDGGRHQIAIQAHTCDVRVDFNCLHRRWRPNGKYEWRWDQEKNGGKGENGFGEGVIVRERTEAEMEKYNLKYNEKTFYNGGVRNEIGFRQERDPETNRMITTPIEWAWTRGGYESWRDKIVEYEEIEVRLGELEKKRREGGRSNGGSNGGGDDGSLSLTEGERNEEIELLEKKKDRMPQIEYYKAHFFAELMEIVRLGMGEMNMA